MADIGAGDGIISKVCAQLLNVAQLDMYEPYVQENAFYKPDTKIKFGFHTFPFDNETKKFDIITIQTTLHHVMNPEFIIQKCMTLLNPGGIILLREH